MPQSKTHQDYWTNRLRKRDYRDTDGTTKTVDEWQVYIQHKGRREWFQLGSSNKVVAAKRAAEIYQSLKVIGWDETIIKFKGVMHVKKKSCTIGEFIAAVEATKSISTKTAANYYRWLRAIAAHLKGIQNDKTKYNYKSGGLSKWREKVDAIPLAYLTPEKVRKWQREFIAKHKDDPVQLRKTEHSANSAIRNARALFSPKLLKQLKDIEIPSPHPFEGVDMVKSGSMRYNSKVDVPKLVKDAEAALAKKEPQQFKIFLLSLFAGLRRNEIDKLLWSSIDFDQGIVRIEVTQYFTPKTETSIGNIPVDPKVLEILKTYKKSTKGIFVVESKVEPKLGTKYPHYRANRDFEHLSAWLRSWGIDTALPLHTLRKEYGRLVTEQYGIYAASRALRHGSIGITAAHYADDKRQILVKMDNLSGETEAPTSE
jgi:integrase